MQFPGREDLLEKEQATHPSIVGRPWWLRGKESACSVGDLGLILGWRRSPGGGCGSPLQDSCLETPMDRGAWRAAVHGVTKSQTHLSTSEHMEKLA